MELTGWDTCSCGTLMDGLREWEALFASFAVTEGRK